MRKISKIGEAIGKKWKSLAKENSLPIVLGGLNATINFTLPLKDWLKYKTLITQEMLKNNILAANAVYTCLAHKEKYVSEYFEKLNPIFSLINECENGRNIDDLLEGPISHDGFKKIKLKVKNA